MTIIYLGIAWLVGIALGAALDLPLWSWLVSGLVACLLASLFHRHRPALYLILLGALLLGAARLTLASLPIGESHVAHFNGAGELILTGPVVEEPDIRDRYQQLTLEAEEIELPDGSSREVEGLVLLETGRYPIIPYGARLQVTGELEKPPADPDFDWRGILARRGIHSRMSYPRISQLAAGEGSPFKQAIYDIKDRGRQTIQGFLPDPQAALLTGILLGDDSGMPAELARQFRVTGLTHIIAISGFNIAILAGILLAISRPFLGYRWSAWFVLVGIALYTVLVGAEAAVVRAAIMAALVIIAARLLGRPTFVPAALFLAAICMTAVNPFILWDIGFQLSFAATLALMLYVGPVSRWTEAKLGPQMGRPKTQQITRVLAEVLFATLAAMVLTLPIILYHFGQLSLVSPLANLFVLPAQPGVMIWGGLATLTGMVFPALGQLLAWVAWIFLTYTISMVRFFAAFPAASVPVTLSPAGVLLFYAVIMGLTWFALLSSERRADLMDQYGRKLPQRAAFAGLAIAAILIVTWLFSQPDGDLHVHFLDVGQGDATFIQTPSGRQILIDGGAYPTLLNDHLGRIIPFWDRDIDLIIATHPDADHIAALPGIFGRYRVGRLITNGQTVDEQSAQALLAAAVENETAVHQVSAGEVIAIEDGVKVAVLNPAAGVQVQIEEHDNDRSVALRLTYGDFSLLLTGDASEIAEKKILVDGQPLSAVVYKAGHHGAKSSSSAGFLEAVRPQYVIVSAGEGNRYGHPHDEVLERVTDVGAAVLRTDELGTIELISDGQALWWQASLRE